VQAEQRTGSSLDPAERGDPLLVFVHIPKTAGMTLATILQRHYGDACLGGPGEGRHESPEERAPNVFSRFEHVDARLRAAAEPSVRAVAGHITFGLADRLPANSRYLTVLRDPVERTLSHYYFLVRPPAKQAGRAGIGFVPPWLPPPRSDLSLDEALSERSYIPDNLQTRMLCGLVSPFDPLPADGLASAKHNLRDRFAFVGKTEQFEEFLALLNLELGWPTVAPMRSNLNSDRPRRADVDPELLQLAEERNALDRELHAYAGELLAESLAQVGPELAVEVEVLRRAEAERQNGTPELDRSWPVEARVTLAVKEAELAEASLRIKRLRSRLKHS
jgi:hypothetical protein